MGALVSYTWHPEGELFPVREGKTFIGSGDISSEAFHRSCDVQIPEDRRMSGEHALILCRHGAYEIIDQASSNGTFLNGKMLKANDSTEIPNYATIQTGFTVWTFIHIEAPREIVVQSSTSRDEEEPPEPPRRRRDTRDEEEPPEPPGRRRDTIVL
jgi:pSer/pThr/pTyr-binding forkhead associated (FHA) protein